MNKNAIFLALYTLLILLYFPIYGQTGGPGVTTKVKLRLPSDLYFEMSPYRKGHNKIVFNVDFLLKGLAMVTSDNKTSKLIFQQGLSDTLGKRKIGYLIATPLYDSTARDADTALYFFGKGGGDDGVMPIHSAAVKVFFTEDSDPSIKLVCIRDRLKFGVKEEKIRSLKDEPSDFSEKRSNQEFIRIETPGSKKATIFIDYEIRRGNVLVCIFNPNNGDLLAILDPKKPNQSFTTKNNVYVFPLIRPFVTSNLTGTNITFQVGDPKVNGSVTASEE